MRISNRSKSVGSDEPTTINQQLDIMIDGMFSEVKIDHYDDIQNVWCVDAWKSSDENEEGEVIAKIEPETFAIEYTTKQEVFRSREFWKAVLDFMQSQMVG